MDYKLEEIVDIPLLQELQNKLNMIYSFPSAIIDNNGKILTAVAWQDICTKFHRVNPECEKECIKSDKYILEHLHEANPAVSYQCPHGMIDNAAPIIIDGNHLGNFFTGQFFLDKPDLDFFKKQAEIYGFDEKAYLEAVEKVPIWTKDKLSKYLDFIKGFIEVIAGIGLNSLKRIEATKLIKESEDRCRNIIQCTSDWIWEIDEHWNYCYCSENIEKILGYKVSEIIGKSPFDLMFPDERERISIVFQNIVDTKRAIVDLENWNLHKDGHKVCLLTNGFPIFNESGKIIGYRGADKVITERKRSEESLIASEIRYRRLFESAKDGILILDAETGMVVDVNPFILELLGYSKIDFIGRYIWELGFLKDIIANLENFLELQSKEYIRYDDLPLETSNGILKNVEFVSNVYQVDGKKVIQCNIRDITERKKGEMALRESQTLYQDLVETSQDLIWQCDIKGRYIYLNPAWEEVLGYKIAEMLGKKFTDFQTPERAEFDLREFSRLLQGGTLKGFETIHINKNGKEINLVFNAKFITDKNNNIIGTHGTAYDITERKQVEDLLKLNEARLEGLLRISQHNAETVQDFLNYALNEVILLTQSKIGYIYFYDEIKKEFTLNTWSKNVMKECTIENKQTIYQLEKTGIWGEVVRQRKAIIVNDFQAPNPLKKGYPEGHAKLVRFLSIPIFNENKIVAVVGVANKEKDYDSTDTRQLILMMDSVWKYTEHKFAEEALRESEEKFRSIAENLPDLLYITDKIGRITYVSPASVKIFNYSDEEMIGHFFVEFLEPAEVARVIPVFEKSIRSGVTSKNLIINARRKNGDSFFAELNSSILRKNGIIQGTQGLIRDLTDAKKAEEEHLRLQNLESLGVLAGGIAHDFNNILTSIMGRVSIAMRYSKEEGENENLLAVEKACKRAVGLTHQLLTFAKGGSPKKCLIDISKIIKDTTMFSLSGSNVTTEYNFNNTLSLEADPGQIAQVIQNIVINAKQAMPSGGTIKISTENYNDFENNKFLKINIKDEGIGIPKEYLTKIFDPYYTTKQTGSGLGLSVCYSIIRRHEGRIFAHSEIGKGTIFTILLPGEEKENIPVTASSKIVTQKYRILIMDDEEDIRELLSNLLLGLGHIVLVSSSGEEALQIYENSLEKRKFIDLVFMDLTIKGGMGGKETIIKLREIDPKAKVIVSSGYADTSIANFRESGFDGALNKPYTIDDLNNAIFEVMGK